jgi:hypothetical protein
MRALQFLSLRLRVFIAAVVLASGMPSAAWSAILFTNGWEGLLDDSTQIITGEFFLSDPFPLLTATADINSDVRTATWFGPGGDSITTEFTEGVPVDDVPFEQYTGMFTIVSGTGAYELYRGGGTYSATFLTLADGSVRVTSLNQGEITVIPEPAIWLMLTAGLGLLGFVRLRRAAQSGF